MPYFATSQEWLEQSALLLQARPSTTRIVTKYTLLHARATKNRNRTRAHKTTTSQPAPAPAPAPAKAALTLKTYDTASGVCLKYQTAQAAQVGRLVASLERLGRGMAALRGGVEDAAGLDVPLAEQGTGSSTPLPEAGLGAGEAKLGLGGGGGGGAGGKKKKKGGRK